MNFRVIALVISLLCYDESCAESFTIDFYGESLEFHWQSVRILKKPLDASEKSLRRFYNEISSRNDEQILHFLSNSKRRLVLNDWLYYELIGKVSNAIADRKVTRAYLRWYLLASSGYKASIIFEKANAYVTVESSEAVHGFPKSRRGYCLDCPSVAKSYIPSRFNPFPRNKIDFSFAFSALPTFSKDELLKKKFILSKIDGSKDTFEAKFSPKLISCLEKWGNRNLKQTFLTPLSEGTKAIIQEFEVILRGQNDSSKIEYITDFVRQNSIYESDESVGGNASRWLTPEEFLFYDSGDCEDRCSFLYYALKEILDKPLIILTYQNHVNLAISLELNSPCNFYYKDLPYYIIEPTSRVSDPIPLGKYVLRPNEKFQVIE